MLRKGCDVGRVKAQASIVRRYRQALEVTAAKEAVTRPGASAAGYWVNEHLFYFRSERRLPSLGRVVGAPAIADCKTSAVADVISIEALARLLAGQSDQELGLDRFASAEIDITLRPEVLSVRIAGCDYRVDVRGERVLAASPAIVPPALYSPDGRYACFIRDYDIWLKVRASGAERPLTSGGRKDRFFGQESQANLSILSYRRCPRPAGLWSWDSRWFLTIRVDEQEVPDSIVAQYAVPARRPILHRYKYPLPGDPLPSAVFMAIEVESGDSVEFNTFPVEIGSASPFLQRRVWFDDSGTIWVLRQDRHCRYAELVALEPESGSGRVVIREVAGSGYLNFNPFAGAVPNVRTLAATHETIWYSERDGWGHLYLYDNKTGLLKNQITAGKWLVRDIVHVDERRRLLLLLAGGIDPEADPARRSLCSVNLDGSGFQVLLAHDGDIYVPVAEPAGLGQDRPDRLPQAPPGVSPNGQFAVVQFLSLLRGNRTRIVDLLSGHGFDIATALPDSHERRPCHFSSVAGDGLTRLHGAMFLPPGFDRSRRYPLIDYIYPGPQVSHQPQSFRSMNAALARSLAELGFVIIMLDTRAMPLASRAFQQAGEGNLLEPQLCDHASVVRDLCSRMPFIDASRIGIVGHSAGGAAAARAMFDYGDTFHVGVAVSGNHEPAQYAAVWADKYCGLDSACRAAQQGNGHAAHKLQGKLLLITGDMDENVQINQTLALVESLIRANRDFELLIVPNADHNVLMTHGYAQRRVWDYFVRNLLGEVPPADFEVRFSSHEIERLWARSMQELT